ncbi:MAG: histidine kinase [Bacteroidales bacterium]|nr:histidine kinase [Bacteroidales bacterium]
MQNPILSKKLGIIVFAIWWTAMALAQFAALSIFYGLKTEISAIDSLVYNIIFAALSLGIWYWVRYSDLEKQKIFNIVLNHLASATLSILIWITISDFILKSIFPNDNSYIDFLNTSLPWRIAIGTFYYILSGLIYYLIIYIQNFREQTMRESEIKTLVRDAELNWLKHQINPHFLFNSLNSISSLTMSNPEKAQEMVIRLSDLLRYSLKQSSQSFVSISDEISNCVKYLEIEKVRFGKRLNYSISAPDAVMDFQVPAMILQPLFENAIKHGIASSSEQGEVKAVFESNQNFLKIIISNTMPEESQNAKGMGVGLVNISRRLSLLYGQNDLLKSNIVDSNYIVEVIIPKLNR